MSHLIYSHWLFSSFSPDILSDFIFFAFFAGGSPTLALFCFFSCISRFARSSRANRLLQRRFNSNDVRERRNQSNRNCGDNLMSHLIFSYEFISLRPYLCSVHSKKRSSFSVYFLFAVEYGMVRSSYGDLYCKICCFFLGHK